MSLSSDTRAPTGLTDNQKSTLELHPKIMKLRDRRDRLSKLLRSSESNERERLLAKKRKTDLRLQSTRVNLRRRKTAEVRKRYFRQVDSRELDDQVGNHTEEVCTDEDVSSTITPYLAERKRIAVVLDEAAKDMTHEKSLQSRVDFVASLAALCNRKEVRRRVTGTTAEPEEDAGRPQMPWIPMKCQPTQCIFCLSEKTIPYVSRSFCYSRRAKMMDHVEGHHLKDRDPSTSIACPHPICADQALVLKSVMHLKAHVEREHGIALRS